MKKILYILLMLLVADFVGAVVLHEVFPNPLGSDNNHEFIEIYHEGFVNLSQYIIDDIKSNDTLEGMQWSNSNYSLVVEEGFDYVGMDVSVYSVGATIGNNLGNTEDGVFFYDTNGTLLDSFVYTETIEGYSWERNASGWFVSSVENGTVGRKNSIEVYIDDPKKPNESNETALVNSVSIRSLLPETMYLYQRLTKGFRIDNKRDEKINALLFYEVYFEGKLLFNETQSFANISRYRTKDTFDAAFTVVGNYTICGNVISDLYEEDFSDNIICSNVTVIDLSLVACDRFLELEIDDRIFSNREKIHFTPVIRGDYVDVPFVFSYWIEEMHGNMVKKPRESGSTTKKSWTPKIEKPYGVYILHAAFVDTLCNDTNVENNRVDVHLIVENHLDNDGALALGHVYAGSDNMVRTGEVVRAKLQYYTGNLSGKVAAEKKLRAFVKDNNGHTVSEVTTFAVAESFVSGEIMLPVLLDYSCKKFPIDTETYTFVVQGFGESVKEKFSVQGVKKDLCGVDSGGGGEYNNIVFAVVGMNNSNVSSSIVLHNIDTTPHEYKVSSKIYRGPKTYSGNHFANMKTVLLNPGVEKKITLVNSIEDVKSGDYNIKFQIERDDRKTVKEFRDTFVVAGSVVSSIDKNKGSIVSFGSLSHEVTKDMLVYGVVEGKGNYTLIFDDSFSRENKAIYLNGTEKVVFNTSLVPGKNNLVLRLLEEEKVVASEPLILYTADYEIEDVTATEAVVEPYKSRGFGLVTGNVIGPVESYESGFYKIRAVLNYLLISLLLGFNIFLLFRKQ